MTGKPQADPCSRAEGLKGDSGGKFDELDGFGSGGGKGRLGRTIRNERVLVLCSISDDLDHLEQGLFSDDLNISSDD